MSSLRQMGATSAALCEPFNKFWESDSLACSISVLPKSSISRNVSIFLAGVLPKPKHKNGQVFHESRHHNWLWLIVWNHALKLINKTGSEPIQAL
mmetsp:Transcript_32901/g.59581  ORF Transcript_32901/g.59581 Transcript_32901/m.59581 type:complete len:95 (-) Transcript_32901:577-861(-)